MKGMKFGILGVCVALSGASDALSAVGTFTLHQTDESLGNGASWAVGLVNDSQLAADANRASSGGADIRDLGPDGSTDPAVTTRKRIAVMKWDLGSIVGPGETISSITLQATNTGQATGNLIEFFAAIDGGAADLQGETLLETQVTALNWAGYNFGGSPPPAGGFDSTIPLDLPQFAPVGSSAAPSGLFGVTISDGDLLAAANADTNGVLMIAALPTSDRGITLTRGNVNSDIRLVVTVVPEPASLALVGLGGLAVLRRRVRA